MFFNVFKIRNDEGFADDLVGCWQVDVFPDRDSDALYGESFATWQEAMDAVTKQEV